MFYNSSDYPKAQTYRSDRLAEARRDHLAKITNPATFKFPALRRCRRLLVVAVALVILVALPVTAGAQDKREAGDNEPFATAIMAYRLGHYYYVTGQYDRAVEHYTQAIDGIPAEIFAFSVDYAVMYWDMGDALLLAGQYAAALDSYQHFVDLLDGGASAEVIAFVAQLETAVAQGVVTLQPMVG